MPDDEDARETQPPDGVTYDLEEALTLLAALEEVRDTMLATGHLVGVIEIDTEVRLLNRRLGFGEDHGGIDG